MLVMVLVVQACGSTTPTPQPSPSAAAPAASQAAAAPTAVAPAATPVASVVVTTEPTGQPGATSSPTPVFTPVFTPTPQPAPTASDQVAPSAVPTESPGPTAPAASPGPTPAPGSPSSDELINDALAKGEITAEQATIYRAFLSFDDPRLPQEFRGNDEGRHDARAWWLDLPSLSPDAQALLRPFLLRPDVEGSWYYTTPAGEEAAAPGVELARFAAAARPPGAWLNVTGPTIRVLYTKERLAGRAQQVLAEAEAVVWPALLRLLGQVPPADCAFLCGDRGGSRHYDIYLVDKASAFRSYELPDGACSETSSHIVLNQSADFDVLAHELMHAFEDSFLRAGSNACAEWRWFDEAAAQWAIDYVYKRRFNPTEQVADWYLDDPSISLNVKDDSREYGAYVFFFFLSKVAGSPDLIRQILTRARVESDSLLAIDRAIPGGFAKQFPDFAKYSWNPTWNPLNQYRIVDDLKDRAQPDAGITEELAGKNRLVELFKSKVNYLSAVYYHYEVIDPDVRGILFVNGYTYKVADEDVGRGLHSYTTTDLGANAPARKYGKVIALVKREGRADWDIEDWTNQASAFFCQDDPKRLRLEEVVVILTNSNPDRSSPPIQNQGIKPGFWVSNMGCYQWKGTATFQDDDHVWTLTASVTWERVGINRQPPGGTAAGASNRAVGLGLAFMPVAGTLLWEASGRDSSGCSHNGDASFTFLPGSVYPATILMTMAFVPSGSYVGTYWGRGAYNQVVTDAVTCRDGTDINKISLAMIPWVVTCEAGCAVGQFPRVDATGTKMSGIFGKKAKAYWEWDFTSVAAP